MSDPEKNKTGLALELVACERCKNAFMRNKGDATKVVCDNCIQLEKRKRELQLGVFEKVIEVENKMEDSINEMTNQLTITRGTFNKEFFLREIKKRSEVLIKSIELVEKIEETNDEKYIEKYKELFQKLKEDRS